LAPQASFRLDLLALRVGVFERLILTSIISAKFKSHTSQKRDKNSTNVDINISRRGTGRDYRRCNMKANMFMHMEVDVFNSSFQITKTPIGAMLALTKIVQLLQNLIPNKLNIIYICNHLITVLISSFSNGPYFPEFI